MFPEEELADPVIFWDVELVGLVIAAGVERAGATAAGVGSWPNTALNPLNRLIPCSTLLRPLLRESSIPLTLTLGMLLLGAPFTILPAFEARAMLTLGS